MCGMVMDSRVRSIRIVVFVLTVTYEVSTTLNICGADLNVWGTDVKDDLPWSVCDGMNGHLREYLATAKELEGATEMTYLRAVPKATNGLDMFKPLLSGFLRLTNGSRVTGMMVVFM